MYSQAVSCSIRDISLQSLLSALSMSLNIDPFLSFAPWTGTDTSLRSFALITSSCHLVTMCCHFHNDNSKIHWEGRTRSNQSFHARQMLGTDMGLFTCINLYTEPQPCCDVAGGDRQRWSEGHRTHLIRICTFTSERGKSHTEKGTPFLGLFYHPSIAAAMSHSIGSKASCHRQEDMGFNYTAAARPLALMAKKRHSPCDLAKRLPLRGYLELHSCWDPCSYV